MATATLTASERRALKKHYASVDCRVQWLVVIEAITEIYAVPGGLLSLAKGISVSNGTLI
jgi:hypothetical protein